MAKRKMTDPDYETNETKRTGLWGVPWWIPYVLMIAAIVGTGVFAAAVRVRLTRTGAPRIDIIPGMDHQAKYRAQTVNPAFADGRAMRPPVEGTVAVGELNSNTHLYEGKINGQWAKTIPVTVTDEVMRRGQERFNIYCATCHGLAGDGSGMMHKRALENEETTWTPPANYHDDRLRAMPAGQIFNTITNGVRNMAAYGPQIPVRDRWAMIAYMRALQRSRHAVIDDVPEDEKDRLK